MKPTSPNELSATKQALLKIRELKRALQQADSERIRDTRYEPIAIVSMACRFPRSSSTPERFWQSLIDQSDEVSEIPESRWNLAAFHDDDANTPGRMYARHGVFLDELDQMDPAFFGISPREATWVDPQQRPLMEVGWEALENAGWVADRIGDETGVFVGWMHNDYQNEASDSFLNLNPYIATGAAGSFLSGRLAYYLGLHGPSIAIDTACSSSLVALHVAIRSLQQRDCDRALVGGVNAICSPTTNILTCKLKALSPTGQSRAFDAAADGYLRGEGCGVVALRRWDDAQREGDPILGIIRGSAVGHNGFGSGLTVPNPKAQEQVIRQAMERAQLAPEDIAYLEAHGTGTELGDPIEMRAAAAAIGGSRTADHRLLVGSVKTNIGHLEAAAGMAGLIKVLLCMQKGQLAGQMNFETPNPHIPWDELPVEVLTQVHSWPEGKRRIAGVSAFGMSGTNAHVIVEARDVVEPTATTLANNTPAVLEPAGTRTTNTQHPQLFTLSAKSLPALYDLAEKYARALSTDASASPISLSYTSTACRSHFEHRAAFAFNNVGEAVDHLRALARTEGSENVALREARQRPMIAWQFTGQGSQYVGMARGLYDTQPDFRATIDECDAQLRELRGDRLSLQQVIFGDDNHRGGQQDNAPLHDTTWTQPAIFAIQMGLAKWLQCRGITPDVVLGHSVGQYAAACMAGVMSWQDGLTLISERGRLIGELPTGGQMVAVFASLADVESALVNHNGVSLAADNGTHVVISGSTIEVNQVAEQFESRGIRTKTLTTSHAFHSALMNPALDAFRNAASKINFQSAEIPLVCNVTGELIAADEQLDADYWTRHIRNAVRYADSVDAVVECGCNVMLELGPQAVLTRMASAKWVGEPSALISCLRAPSKSTDDGNASVNRSSDDATNLLRAVAALYTHGATPDFTNWFTRRIQPLALPNYPFQRQSYWGPAKPRAAHAEHHTAHPLLGGAVALAGVKDELRFENYVDVDSPSWLADHQLMGGVVMPGAAFVETALAAANGSTSAFDPVSLREISFEQPLRLTDRTAMQTVVRKGPDGTQRIETYAANGESSQLNFAWMRHFTAAINQETTSQPDSANLQKLQTRLTSTMSSERFYQAMNDFGLNYGPTFQTIQDLHYADGEVLVRLSANTDFRGYAIAPPLLDGALHALAVWLIDQPDGNFLLPRGIGTFHCWQPVESDVWAHATWKQREGKSRTADITLFDESGTVVATVCDLRVEEVSIAALRRLSGQGPSRLTYEIAWQPTRLGPPTKRVSQFLIVSPTDVSPQQQFAITRTEEELSRRGHEVIAAQFCGKKQPDVDTNGVVAHTQNDGYLVADQKDWSALLSNELDKLDGVVWFVCDGQESELAHSQTTIGSLLSFLGAMMETGRRELACGMTLVTNGGAAVTPEVAVDPEQSKYWGLARVIGAERPGVRCRIVDLPLASFDAARADTAVAALGDILLTETNDSQFAIHDDRLLVPRLQSSARSRSVDATSSNENGTGKTAVRADRSYLITGGLGQLGRQAARWLAEQNAGEIILVSRRQPDQTTQAFLQSLTKNGTITDEGPQSRIIVHNADVSRREDVDELFSRIRRDCKPLGGILHIAGVLDDGNLESQTWQRFEKVLGPKIEASRWLDELTRDEALDFFILYSSAAAILGSPGQSNYATGNAYLDGLAHRRRAEGRHALSINWGPWTEGMADDERIMKRLMTQGIAPLSVDDAHAAMEHLLGQDATQATVINADWQRLRQSFGGTPLTLLDNLAAGARKTEVADSALVEQLRTLDPKSRRKLLVTSLQSSLQAILSTADLPEPDRPLIEMGLDSLMAVEFGTDLQQLLGGQFMLSPALLFDHPTIDALADHMLEQIVIPTAEAKNTPATPKQALDNVDAVTPTAASHEPIAVVGMSCRFPGADSVEQFWNNLLRGVDSVGNIPDDRWDIDRFYAETPQPGKMSTREGGFIGRIGDFDREFFGVSAMEACWMDPQHRLLLENSYHALEDAGIVVDQLPDNRVGVFMGIMGNDYAFLPSLDDEFVIRGFQGAGLSHSAGVGRISFAFGFEGPSVAVDTASSSSLVAVHQAVRSLRERNCNLALAGGVNAILAPVNSLLMSKAGLLSPDGRCKSFSADASGFGRGEGCGVVALKRLKDAQRDGDRILALIQGTAVLHNGTSSGITSPNGKAQGRVIEAALRDARVDPAAVDYLEAHGTGTPLGDPIEIAAAAAVYGKGRQHDNPLLVGSVKANISHLEAAGGISGLIKTVLALHHKIIPPQIHFDTPSAHIPWRQLPLQMVDKTTAWPRKADPDSVRLAGVTALGLVGTNAHVILSSHADPPAEETNREGASTPQLLVISARTPDALNKLCSQYGDFLEANPDIQLADVCSTAATHRRHFEFRRVVIGQSRTEMLEQLGQPETSTNGPPHGWSASSGGCPQIGWYFPNRGDVTAAELVSTVANLYSSEPLAAALLDQFATSLDEHDAARNEPDTDSASGVPWQALFRGKHALSTAEENSNTLDIFEYAIQAAVANLWLKWGVEPDAALGFGVGQITAAAAAGCVGFGEGLLLVRERHEKDDERFEAFADQFNFYPPKLPLVCSASANVVAVHRTLGGSYWREQRTAALDTAAPLATLESIGCDITLNFGIHQGELDSEREHLPVADSDIPLKLKNALAELYIRGYQPNFAAVYDSGSRQRVALPLYPYQRRRYWITELEQFVKEKAMATQ